MLIPIALVDDLEEDSTRLRGAINRWFEAHPEHSCRLYVYQSAEAMLEAQPHVVMAFLDIRMDGLSGIELARRLRNLDEKILLVFLSTSREYAFDAFPIHPFDYLDKPCRQEDVSRVMNEALRLMTTVDPTVVIRVARAEHEIPMRRIVSVVASGHNVDVTLVKGAKLRSIMTFSELEAMLSKNEAFLPCNRGVLINMDHVIGVRDDMFLMQDGSSFPLRSRGRAELMARFTQYQISRLKGGYAHA